jgi:hypothetical protein
MGVNERGLGYGMGRSFGWLPPPPGRTLKGAPPKGCRGASPRPVTKENPR